MLEGGYAISTHYTWTYALIGLCLYTRLVMHASDHYNFYAKLLETHKLMRLFCDPGVRYTNWGCIEKQQETNSTCVNAAVVRDSPCYRNSMAHSQKPATPVASADDDLVTNPGN